MSVYEGIRHDYYIQFILSFPHWKPYIKTDEDIAQIIEYLMASFGDGDIEQ